MPDNEWRWDVERKIPQHSNVGNFFIPILSQDFWEQPATKRWCFKRRLIDQNLHMLKERTSPVWITSRSPDASLWFKENHNKHEGSANPRRRREGRKRRSFSMTAHWAAPWPRIDLVIQFFSKELKALNILWCPTYKPEFCPYSGLQLFIPWPLSKYLVMPPGPGPTSTTWHPAKDPPALATLSNRRGSRMKFCESRFWAWNYAFSIHMDCSLILYLYVVDP